MFASCRELMMIVKIIIAVVVELSIPLVRAVFGDARPRACSGEA
jgi:hypothetical protein